ncbi:hypothetical protein Lpp225_0822 [Lacticaseibacillus paracasei subsp. paracasei Lpp225]|uniref:DUF1642 domain-containing protein n=1 Tax=Lacticaseibacillus paracasei subsp. paracasei Lpp225 TaxID=1256225 RepID=S2NUS8_LACPA|nr:hypothetical protein Lpp225_0822 [Lacticaseibacillus paracasei subsp. paracasei Lpp225]
MSEEKMYAVKNDEGKYWDFEDQDGFWELNTMNLAAIAGEEVAECVARDRGGHVVTFVEEPKKVAVSPNEAQAIESLLNANTYVDVYDPFKYLFTSRYKKDIKRLIEAIKNGYTVEKEKKYRVLAPRSWWYAIDAPLYLLRDFTDGMRLTVKRDDPSTVFTKKQLNAFELDGAPFTKEEVTDDDD